MIGSTLVLDDCRLILTLFEKNVLMESKTMNLILYNDASGFHRIFNEYTKKYPMSFKNTKEMIGWFWHFTESKEPIPGIIYAVNDSLCIDISEDVIVYKDEITPTVIKTTDIRQYLKK